MASPREQAILRRVAVMAVRDARAAWKKTRARPTEATLRAAFRACVLAARTMRKAAEVSPRDADRMVEQAARLEVAAEQLKRELVRYVEAPAQ